MSEAPPPVADLGLHAEPVPAGARCEAHPDASAIFRCALCRAYHCEHCLWGKRAAREICATCAAPGLPAPVAWERRDQIGVIRAFVASVGELLTSPVRFYRTPALEDDAVGGFEHGLASFAIGQVAVIAQALVTVVLFGSAIAIATHTPWLGAFFGGYGCLLVGLVPAMLVHVPVTTLVTVGVSAVCIHGTLQLFGAAKAPFYAGTVRATSYAFATHVLFAVPVVGPLVALVWTIVLETIGIREVHRTSTAIALIAVLGYRLVFVGVLALAYAMLIVAGIAAAAR